jgi:CMP-N-acetylneuraminic acid synthetase
MLHNRRYGTKESRLYILPPKRAVNVDTEIDFLVAEELMKKIKWYETHFISHYDC